MSHSQQPQQRHVQLRFYEELNDFLPAAKKRRAFSHAFTGQPTVKQLVESIGLAASQIDLILVNDQPVSLDHTLEGGENVAVFPVFESFETSPANRLRSRPQPRTRFVLDVGLEKLTRLLRLSGLDCLYDPNLDDLRIIQISTEEKRTILSKNGELLKNAKITHGYLVQLSNPPGQFAEVIKAFDLRNKLHPFSRCMECNGKLRRADDTEAMDQIPFAVLVAFDDFWRCDECEKIYWKGSHYKQLFRLLEEI